MKGYALSLALVLSTSPALAEEISTLKEAVSQAVLQNPEVNASWYSFESTKHEQRAGVGGYYPKVDLTAQTGRERVRTSGVSDWGYYDPFGANLTLTQMLFDGFATKNDVERLNQSRQASFYEFLDVSEKAALEASRAYLDTLRFQQLVELAKENYVEHRTVYADIERRTAAGVGREVDLEQASARLALAESNLLTEATNLHDVAARFQRVVGVLPAEALQMPDFNTSLIPEQRVDAIGTAYTRNPSLQAAVRRIDAAEAELKVRKAAMMPRIDLRASTNLDDHENGVPGRVYQDGIHLVLSYNLYNGGSDSARNRQYIQKTYVAREQRDKICRDVRQQVVIAHNDIDSLEQQSEFLDRNQLAISKARVAYRDQFDIGQRTLLDLLDTENEYFEVQRAYVNAEHDLQLAQVRTLASMGMLLDGFSQTAKGTDLIATESSRPAPCPIEAPGAYTIDKEALMAGLLPVDSVYVQDERFRELDDGGLAFSMRAQFAFGSAELAEDYDKDINDGAEFLKQNPEISAVVEGHTDSVGSDAYNQNLSMERAQAVHDRLVEQGIDPERLSIVGHGEAKPMADNSTSAGREINRRVDLVVEGLTLPAQ